MPIVPSLFSRTISLRYTCSLGQPYPHGEGHRSHGTGYEDRRGGLRWAKVLGPTNVAVQSLKIYPSEIFFTAPRCMRMKSDSNKVT